MTTFADIVADAFDAAPPFDTAAMAAAILADPRFVDLLAGVLHDYPAVCAGGGHSAEADPHGACGMLAAAVIRSLGETK